MNPVRLCVTDALGAKVILAQAGETANTTTSKGAPAGPAGAGGKATGGGAGIESLMFPLAIAFVVIFLMIMPQRKKEKQRRQMLADLRKGDHVVTIGGVHGEISQIGEQTAIVTVDAQEGTTLKISRSAISRVVTDDEAEQTDQSR